jgi:mycothiol synthase
LRAAQDNAYDGRLGARIALPPSIIQVTVHPPSPYRARRASLADAGAVEELVNAALKEDIGMILYAPGELRDKWTKNGLAGCVIVVDEDREPAGCLIVETEGEASLYFEDYVLSAHRGRGLGEFLIGRAEDHARRMARETQRSIAVTTNVNNDRGRAVLVDLGYELEDRDYAMFMDLEPGRPVTTWPPGIRLRPYRDGIDDDLMHETMVAGFGDDWPEDDDRTRWLNTHKQAPGYEPELWYFAETDDRVIGAAQCRSQWRGDRDTGWIKNLSVVPDARHRGAGRALLGHAFDLFVRRRRKRAVLGVDFDNPTNAKDFYRVVGMYEGGSSTDHRKVIGPS